MRVSDFGGKSLGTVGSSAFEINPDIREAGNLRAWYDGGGGVANSISLGTGGGGGGGGARQDRFMNFAQIKEETAAGCPAALWVQARAAQAVIIVRRDSSIRADALLRRTPQTRAYLTHLKPNQETGVMYPACPRPAENAAQAGRTCQKKLRHDGTSGTWRVHARASCLRHTQRTDVPCRCFAGSARSTLRRWTSRTGAT